MACKSSLSGTPALNCHSFGGNTLSSLFHIHKLIKAHDRTVSVIDKEEKEKPLPTGKKHPISNSQ